MPSIIANHEVVLLCSHALKCYDKRLMDHSIRVAYLAEKLHQNLKLDATLNGDMLFLMSVFHDIGAYKTEEIDRMIVFETVDVDAHAIYGYLFLKHLSPLEESAQAVRYHHTPAKGLVGLSAGISAYAQIIHMADRMDMGIARGLKGDALFKSINLSGQFDAPYIAAAKAVVTNQELYQAFPAGVEQWSQQRAKALNLSAAEVDSYLEMIVYSMDFKSNATMVHSVNTTTVAMFLAEYLGFSKKEVERIYYAALVHDIGKIAIPGYILESKEKLKKEDMDIMRSHAELTRKMLEPVFEPTIVDYAADHHEKLNGSGYPQGLSDAQLSVPVRIVAIADIISALLGNRSYKSAYGWDKTIIILEDMVRQHLIDGDIVNIVIENKDELQRQIEEKALPVKQKYEQIHKEFEALISAES